MLGFKGDTFTISITKHFSLGGGGGFRLQGRHLYYFYRKAIQLAGDNGVLGWDFLGMKCCNDVMSSLLTDKTLDNEFLSKSTKKNSINLLSKGWVIMGCIVSRYLLKILQYDCILTIF